MAVPGGLAGLSVNSFLKGYSTSIYPERHKLLAPYLTASSSGLGWELWAHCYLVRTAESSKQGPNKALGKNSKLSVA